MGGFGRCIEGEAAGLVGHDDVAVAQVALVYGEEAAVVAAGLVHLALERLPALVQVRTGEHEFAARAASPALAGPAGDAALHVTPAENVQVEPAHLAPAEQESLSDCDFMRHGNFCSARSGSQPPPVGPDKLGTTHPWP